jgi:hypothetical protein
MIIVSAALNLLNFEFGRMKTTLKYPKITNKYPIGFQ